MNLMFDDDGVHHTEPEVASGDETYSDQICYFRRIFLTSFVRICVDVIFGKY